LRTANPALNDKSFRMSVQSGQTMTIQGTVNRTFIMLVALVAAAAYTWQLYFNGANAQVQVLLMTGVIGGLIVALITIFVPKAAPFTAIPYALLEGLVIGGVSAMYESYYSGITLQAATLTFATLFTLLFAYKTRLIKVTKNFRLGVMAATGAIFLVYLASFILGFFGIPVPYLHENGPVGILISLAIVVVAALNLVLDFDFIESGARRNAPKYLEWYGAFGLTVTLVWLYLEMIRLIAKIRSR
jgi:uncharacterized YccA/Bax inhibitor family protein